MSDSSIPPPFHLAFPVKDLRATREFYVNVLRCRVGRESERWIDFDFFGHQITAHLALDANRENTNEVNGDAVPVPHFGCILDWQDWQVLRERLQKGGTNFLIAPRIRFEGQSGEQATMFLTDPSGNALEFKAFRNPERIFAID